MLQILTKNKNDKWYEEIDKMYFSSSDDFTLRPDFDEKHKLFKFFNNDLSDYINDINKLCNDVVSVGAADDLLLHYNVIRNKYDVLHGELLRRGNNHKIVLLSAKAVKHKNDAMLKRISENVDADLKLVMEKVMETLQTMPKQDLEKFIEEERQMLTPRDINYKNFLSDTEIYKSKMLKYIYMTDDILKKKADTFQYKFIISEFYIKNDWMHGKPSIKLCNPLYCSHRKSGNESKASKADWFKYTDEITIGQALDEYANVLDTDKLEDILRTGTNIVVNEDHMKKILHDYSDFYFNRNMGRTSNVLWGLSETNSDDAYYFNQKVRRTHLEFKAFDEMMFYTHKDEYGANVTVLLENNTNIIPDGLKPVKYTNSYFEKADKYVWADDGGEHEVFIEYIPRRYEMTKLGYNTLIQKRRVPFQPTNADNPVSDFTLSYKGGVFDNVNSKACSRMQNALPSQLQLLAAKALQNKEMAKFRGVIFGRDISQVPTELATDKDNPKDILSKIEVIGKKTSTEYFDSEASKNGMPLATRGAPLITLNGGDPNMFNALQGFIQSLDVEVGLKCGVPPSREGISVQGTNVTDNQQSLVQTSLATEKDYFEHGRVWNEAMYECLESWDIYFKRYFEENPDDNNTLLEYITPDGTKELIEILPEHVSQSGYGVYLQDSYSDVEYKKFMTLQMQQNTQDIDIATRSMILKGIANGASSEEIHREIQLVMRNIEKKAQSQQEQELKLKAELKQDQKDLLAYQSNLKVEEADKIANAQKATKIEIAEIESERFALQQDINKDNVADTIEKEHIVQEAQTERLDKELSSKEKIAEQANKTKLEIAKTSKNKNKSDKK